MHKETEADSDPFGCLANPLEFQPLLVQVISCSGGPSQPASCHACPAG